MIDSLYIKIGLVVLGTLVMLSSLVDVQGLISKIIFKKKSVVENNASSTKESDFLEIVSLWYQLKNKCDHFNLKIASDKLDEVFPLLNEVLENDKAI
jgi:hypothetical protein